MQSIGEVRTERKGMAMVTRRARVAVVGADALRSLGLIAILEDALSIEAVAVEPDALFRSRDFEAVLLDVRWAAEQVMVAVARLRRKRRELKVVVMGDSGNMELVQSIIGAGARGYLQREAGEGEIRMAMSVVLDDSIWAPRKVLARLIDVRTLRPAGDSYADEPIEESLSPREIEVLTLLTNGRSNREIAMSMGIEQATVKAHLGRMLRKTGTHNRIELSLRAVAASTEKV